LYGERYLAGEEANATAVGFLIDADEEDGADLKREEAEAVHVAPEGGVVDALDALGVQYRVLAGRQAHVLRCRRQTDMHLKRPLNQRASRDHEVWGELGRGGRLRVPSGRASCWTGTDSERRATNRALGADDDDETADDDEEEEEARTTARERRKAAGSGGGERSDAAIGRLRA
jgi:hypothetical protein